MKKAFFPFVLAFSLLGLSTLPSCETITDIVENLLTQGDASNALKEALRVGTDTAIFNGSATDGYFGNELIKIFLPQEASLILGAASFIPGVSGTLNQLEEKLNRAAEDAAPEAKDILVNAITNITITDAIAIVNGQNDAGTQYLRQNTQADIVGLFKPHIETSLETVGAQSIWSGVTSAYNPIAPLVGQPAVNTDLAEYTTNEAVGGLFDLVAIEEGKIREDPVHRVSQILKDVFGSN